MCETSGTRSVEGLRDSKDTQTAPSPTTFSKTPKILKFSEHESSASEILLRGALATPHLLPARLQAAAAWQGNKYENAKRPAAAASGAGAARAQHGTQHGVHGAQHGGRPPLGGPHVKDKAGQNSYNRGTCSVLSQLLL